MKISALFGNKVGAYCFNSSQAAHDLACANSQESIRCSGILRAKLEHVENTIKEGQWLRNLKTRVEAGVSSSFPDLPEQMRRDVWSSDSVFSKARCALERFEGDEASLVERKSKLEGMLKDVEEVGRGELRTRLLNLYSGHVGDFSRVGEVELSFRQRKLFDSEISDTLRFRDTDES